MTRSHSLCRPIIDSTYLSFRKSKLVCLHLSIPASMRNFAARISNVSINSESAIPTSFGFVAQSTPMRYIRHPFG